MALLPPTIGVAVSALRRNVLRSALTTLGIVIWVAAVIAMVEIGQGSKRAVAESIQSLGANNLLVMPGQAASGGVSFGGGSSPTLTPGDAEAIAKEVPSAVAVAPVVRTRTQLVGPGGKNWVPLYVYGTTSDFLSVRDWPVADGRAFTTQEGSSMAGVCLIGQTVARELFGTESAINQQVRVNNTPLVVIGVLAPKGANTFGADQDDIVLAPWRTIKFKVSGQSAQTANQSADAASSATGINSTTRFPSPTGGRGSLYPTFIPNPWFSTIPPITPIPRRG